MYGPTSKQLAAVKLRPVGKEKSDCQGWYEDGKRDAQKGRPADYGCCQLLSNQMNYLSGYIDGMGWDRSLANDGYADGGEPYTQEEMVDGSWAIIRAHRSDAQGQTRGTGRWTLRLTISNTVGKAHLRYCWGQRNRDGYGSDRCWRHIRQSYIRAHGR